MVMEEEEVQKRCKFWLPKKNRFCANNPLHDSPFCGNHKPRSNDQWVPCPIDPSHSVLRENLEGHVKKCPLLKMNDTLLVQKYYKKGVNGGQGVDGHVTSEMKRSYVHGMNVAEFYQLIRKIKLIHELVCKDVFESYKMPRACNMWINREVDCKLPFQEKHVMQQASILGNLEGLGVIESNVGRESANEDDLDGDNSAGNSISANIPAVVEFGAGRGYLTQMLADCYGIKRVYLVERKSYKLKADRSLRQKESVILERLRIDIEDLNIRAVESLRDSSYIAIGKHLCGPATDLTLRCCLSDQSSRDNAEDHSGDPHLKGLAIATCCHHLCQWKHYTNKSFMTNLGITKEEFHAMTWFTSWAVDGDHTSDLPNSESNLQPNDEGWCCDEKRCSCVEDVIKSMKGSERGSLGFMCKQIIDIGRMMWVKQCGLEAKFVKYVPPTISPENHLLVAKLNSPMYSSI